MNYDYIFDSSNSTCEKEYRIDYESKAPVTVLFEKENVILKADACGNAVFTDTNGKELYKEKAESNRFFSRIYCKVADDKIAVRFPVIETVDHYPNCDGEYDRWSERIVDNLSITFAI